MLTENCLLPKSLSPNSQNPRKAETRMVIARGSGGGTGAIIQRFCLGREKVLAMGGGEWLCKVQMHLILLNYILNCYNGRCYNTYQWQMFHYVHFITLTITT